MKIPRTIFKNAQQFLCNFFSLVEILNRIILNKDQKIRVILRRSETTFSLLQYMSMRNRYFQAWDKIQVICLQNNIAEMFFIMDRSELHFSFYSMSGDDL